MLTPLQMACVSRVVIVVVLIGFTGWMVSLEQHVWAIVGFVQAQIAALAPVKPWENTPEPKAENE